MPLFVDLPSRDAFLSAERISLALVGMSGVGKTHLGRMLRATEEWFHYSVDYRIGTHYMGEHIVDLFKTEAMRNPVLRDMLRSDSIYIASNIAFENLKPLSWYVGKPGDSAKGGLSFDDYVRRQRQHRTAEIGAMMDAALFQEKASRIYGYPHFLCDASGSVVEIVDPEDPDDPVLRAVTDRMLIVQIEGEASDEEELVARFVADPKPMYYSEPFLRESWARYLAEMGAEPETVDPDAFVAWGYRRLIAHRAPRYRAIGRDWGVSLAKGDVAGVASAADLLRLVADALPG